MGKVRFVVKDFPLPSHPAARPAHEAARCAADQGRFWDYHRRLYAAQPRFDRPALVEYAVEVGLARDRFVRCLDGRTFAAAVEADLALGRALGVRSTPTFLVNGRPLIGAQPIEAFRQAVDEALQRER